jgi:hypothetical protein
MIVEHLARYPLQMLHDHGLVRIWAERHPQAFWVALGLTAVLAGKSRGVMRT